MKIASWNVEGRLTLRTKKRRGTPEKILNMIEQINADILVLPEAYIDHPADGVNERLRKMGYQWQDAKYDERDRDPPADIYLRVLSRYEIIETQPLRWGDARGLVAIIVQDPNSGQQIRFIATHLDERSDKRRLLQLNDAIKFINSSKLPTVMLGDFNAMHDDRRSRRLRNKVVKNILTSIPGRKTTMRALQLIEMASGGPLRLLESGTNLRDADVRHQPTTTPKLKEMEWMPSIKMAQIDHIFASPDLNTANFTVFKDGGSDHRAISAEMALKSLEY